MATGVRRMPIASITPDHTNALIIGVIIAKSDVRSFVNKTDGTERGVWGYTIRDSPADTINVTWWGSLSGLTATSQMFFLGDVVEITNPRIKFSLPDDRYKMFKPSVTSPFSLELNENSNCDMVPHLEEDTPLLRKLMRIPTKSAGEVLRLGDITAHANDMDGEFVNLLVVVMHIGAIRNVASRSSSFNRGCRDIVVLDESESEFRLTIWDDDIIHLADLWRPRHTVLFLADLKMERNNFKNLVMPNIRSRTVVTVDPDVPKTEVLRSYAATVPTQSYLLMDHFTDIAETSETPIMSTSKVIERAHSRDGSRFCATIYCHITSFDIDGPTSRVCVFKCQNCGAEKEAPSSCETEECVTLQPAMLPCYSLRVDLSDHRGTLSACRLAGQRAKAVLNCSEDSFMALSIDARTELKWHILFQACAAKVVVQPATHGRPCRVTLLSCDQVHPTEFSAKMPIY